MPFRLLLLAAISAALMGCGKTSAPPPTAAAAPAAAENPAASPEAALASALAELTQTLRKFSVEQRRVPASLDELVTAGYVKNMPQAPPGKKFSIDPKNLQVVLR